MLISASSNNSPDKTILRQLIARLAEVRVLHEHLLWEAAKAVWPNNWAESCNPSKRTFSNLMQANALVDATLLLVATVHPHHLIEAMDKEGEWWVCRMRVGSLAQSRLVSARHPDLAAVILETLLLAEVPIERQTERRSEFRSRKMSKSALRY